MSNQLTSNAEALALFFTEDIYLVGSTQEKQENVVLKKPATEFKYLGKNQKNVLILVNDDKNEVSTEQGRELLRKLVKAIELTANDFALVNYSSYTTETYEDLKTFFKCSVLIAFGVDAVALGLPEQRIHELVQINDVKLLFAKNLHELETDQASKKILWTSLQLLKA